MAGHRILLRCVVSLVVIAMSASLNGQIQKQVLEDNIAKAESYATDLVALSQSLPDRWSARQSRRIFDSSKLDQMKFLESRVEEVWAADRKRDVSYSRVHYGDRSEKSDTTDGNLFDGSVAIRTSGKQVLYKVGDGRWDTIPLVPGYESEGRYPGAEANSTYPLNWSIGLINSSKVGRLRNTEYIQKVLFGKRTCFYASLDKSGNLVSYWGWEDGKKDPATGRLPNALQIVFSKEGLVASYAYVKSALTSKENMAKGDFEKVEEGIVTWKKFPKMAKDGDAITLPVRVEIQSVMNPGEEIECINEITWIFGKAVPDSVFVDPKTETIVEPSFDP